MLGTLPLQAERPNIVIVLADDMGYGDVSCYNARSKIPTPQIDRLAREGMRLTDAHSPAAWCTPSRYGLLTGRYPWRYTRTLDEGIIEPTRVTLASFLQSAGYRTACIGKWHLGFQGSAADRDFSQPIPGGPLAVGFDHFFGMHASLDIPPYYWIQDDRCVVAPTHAIEARATEGWTEIQGEFWRGGKIAPGFQHADVLPTIRDRAVAWIEQAVAASDQPFLLYVPLTAPHTPWCVDDAYRGKSEAGMYGDFTCQVDAVVGAVLESLDQHQLTENTLVIFSSDNGPVWYPQDERRFEHESNGPLRGMKIDLWEGAHRVPFLVRWPGHVPANTVRDELFCFTDVLATCAAVLGRELPEGAGEDSVNQWPVWQNDATEQPQRESLIIERRMVRHQQWKLIRGNPNGGLTRFADPKPEVPASQVLLFDLQSDLGETTNVADQHPEQVERMLQMLQDAI
jgi:arylsulfatase A-like enzyme